VAGRDLEVIRFPDPRPTPLPRYAAPAAALHWRRWDDEEMVVLDTTSGDTHLLSPAAAEVLLALLDAPQAQDAAQLAQRLLPGEQPGCAAADEDVSALQALLSDLARLGLVHAVPATP
jgi:PqqD family protein of HPr-rel-A system